MRNNVYPYRLSSHAHVRITKHGAVFLDLSKDEYLGLDVAQSRALCGLVEGWSAPAGPNTTPDNSTAGLIAELVSCGLLVSSPAHGRGACPPAVDEPTAELIPWDEMPWRHIRPGHVVTFLRVLLVSAVIVRFGGLKAVARRLQKRRAQCCLEESPADVARARELVSAWHFIRIWVYARTGRCLLDSLVLIEFLRCYGIHARWIVGVQTRPFGAHSWAQLGGWILNGTPRFVRGYEPILVV